MMTMTQAGLKACTTSDQDRWQAGLARDRRDDRRRIRIEQPVLRARRVEARDGPANVRARWRRNGDRVRDRRLAAATAARGGDTARRVRRLPGSIGSGARARTEGG